MSFCVTVSLGDVPDSDTLEAAGTPLFPPGASGSGEVGDTPAVRAARQTSSLMALLNTQAVWDGPAKAARVWLGEGLGSLSKRTYDKMLRWEFMDLGEFRPRTATDKLELEGDTEKLVVLPGFEVSQAKKKPVNNIITWAKCFGRYTAAMSQKFPTCTSGFISHMLTVFKAYEEVEDPAWRLYDEAFREKMASTGARLWPGMDVQIYQEVCGGRPRKKVGSPQQEGKRVGLTAATKRPGVCWQFNEGVCTYGKACRFPHACKVCRGNHPKWQCPSGTGAGKRQRVQ